MEECTIIVVFGWLEGVLRLERYLKCWVDLVWVGYVDFIVLTGVITRLPAEGYVEDDE